MEKLKTRTYLKSPSKRFDPFALLISIVGLGFVFYVANRVGATAQVLDVRSAIIVVGGTFFVLLFQFDFTSAFVSIKIILKSLLGTPDRPILKILRQLDTAIINDQSLDKLRRGDRLTGELLNDIVYMYHKGLLYEEIDTFVTTRIADEYLHRELAVSLLNKAATIAPALGLFGTVLGLIGVLRSLNTPEGIGASMSLALLTTMYGTGLGSLVFTPLSGRIEHHNVIYLEAHRQLLNKIGLLLKRTERRMSRARLKEVNAYEVE